MDWGFLTDPSMPPQSQLLHGCYLEAERADRVAQDLDGLRIALDQSFHGLLISLTDIIRQSALLLRDLAALGRTQHTRIPVVASHLHVVLPCLSHTLRAITAQCEAKTLSREIRWRKMYHDMVKEANGLTLPQRFLLYNHFLILLLYLLKRDRRFDPTQFELLHAKILQLRRLRGIADPTQQPPPTTTMTTTTPAVPGQQQHLIVSRPRAATAGTVTVIQSIVPRHQHDSPSPHWLERVFMLLAARTDMGDAGRATIASNLVPAYDPRRPRASRVLLRRTFDGDRVSVKFILGSNDEGSSDEPFVVLRAYGGDSDTRAALVAWKRADDLIATRIRNMVVVLERWSERGEGRWKEWVRLEFLSWEELVLFYTAFVVLKARHALDPRSVSATEYTMAGEIRLFHAKIVDDDYSHTLHVTCDQRHPAQRRRLVATATDGELARCPVWTAFAGVVGPQRLRPERISRRRVLVRGLLLYVFCDNYREASMRHNKAGAFEIYFVREQDAADFIAIFSRRDAPAALEGPDEQECIAGPSYSQ